MEQGGRDRIAEKRLEIFRSGIKSGKTKVTPEVDGKKVVAKITTVTDKGPQELIIEDPDKAAYLIGISEEEKK